MIKLKTKKKPSTTLKSLQKEAKTLTKVQKQITSLTLKDLKYNVDLNEAFYEIDCLQNRLLEGYLRADHRFRRAFGTNFTQDFYQFLRDKARLHEPVHISVIGQVRSGKSYTSIGIATFMMACYNKLFTIEYLCANIFEFLEKLKTMPQEKLTNSCFVIDEEKQSIYGIGSTAKKMKVTDVQNIIAINNISTIMLNPSSWANKEAMYGIRIFGRCRKTFTTRSMLYNLQERGKGGELPMGTLFLPIFTHFLPPDYAPFLEKQYLDKKNAWVMREQRGEGDVLYELKKNEAQKFLKDAKFMELKKKAEKTAYISYKLGSEWTKGEVEEILAFTSLLRNSVLENDDNDKPDENHDENSNEEPE